MNNKGFGLSYSIIGITIALVLIAPITKYLLENEKIKNDTSILVQENIILENEWNKINLGKTEDVFAKKNSKENHISDMGNNELSNNSKYNVSIEYGNPEKADDIEAGLLSMPITITINSEDIESKSISKTGKIYTNNFIDNGLVKNESNPNKIGIKYNEKENSLEYYYNNQEVMKSSKGLSSGTGYIKFKNGLIMQYGNRKNSYFDEDHLEKNIFPLLYPNKCMIVLTSVKKYSGGKLTAYVHDYDKDSFNVLPGYSQGRGSGDYYWVSLGY